MSNILKTDNAVEHVCSCGSRLATVSGNSEVLEQLQHFQECSGYFTNSAISLNYFLVTQKLEYGLSEKEAHQLIDWMKLLNETIVLLQELQKSETINTDAA